MTNAIKLLKENIKNAKNSMELLHLFVGTASEKDILESASDIEKNLKQALSAIMAFKESGNQPILCPTTPLPASHRQRQGSH